MSVSEAGGFCESAAALASSAAGQATPDLWQSNAGATTAHLQLDDFQLVRRLEVGRNPHGIAVPKDQRMIYVS